MYALPSTVGRLRFLFFVSVKFPEEQRAQEGCSMQCYHTREFDFRVSEVCVCEREAYCIVLCVSRNYTYTNVYKLYTHIHSLFLNRHKSLVAQARTRFPSLKISQLCDKLAATRVVYAFPTHAYPTAGAAVA